MKIPAFVLLCCVLLVNGQGQSTTPDSDDDTTTTASTTTTSTTTTPSTTTQEPTTTTTTPPPTTSTTTPAPSPGFPDYPKNIGKWSVEGVETNSSCIELKGAMQIVVVDQNTTETVNIPPYAIASGTCKGKQTITLTWNTTIAGTAFQNSLSLHFDSNSTKEALNADTGITAGKYGLQNVVATLYLNSSNATDINIKDVDKFQTPLNHSYSCLAEELIKSENFTLKIREVQLEAYRRVASGHHEFSSAVQCPADDATDVVPIAVGGALAGLVIIVLIAYLVGRKRSRARGYQSV